MFWKVIGLLTLAACKDLAPADHSGCVESRVVVEWRAERWMAVVQGMSELSLKSWRKQRCDVDRINTIALVEDRSESLRRP